MRTKLILIALVLPLMVVGCKKPDESMATTKPAMATTAPVKAAPVPTKAAPAAAAKAAPAASAPAMAAGETPVTTEPAPMMAEPMMSPPKAVPDTTAIAEAPVATAVVNGTATAACESTRIASIQEFRDTIGDRVFFHYDKADISADGHATLQCQAKWLSKNPAAKVTIEGHADERGTREYNLALGERRANEVKSYLVSLGVDVGQLGTISYGKERPEVNGSNEAAWQQNRRSVSVPAGLK